MAVTFRKPTSVLSLSSARVQTRWAPPHACIRGIHRLAFRSALLRRGAPRVPPLPKIACCQRTPERLRARREASPSPVAQHIARPHANAPVNRYAPSPPPARVRVRAGGCRHGPSVANPRGRPRAAVRSVSRQLPRPSPGLVWTLGRGAGGHDRGRPRIPGSVGQLTYSSS